jgi:hypothetical protein
MELSPNPTKSCRIVSVADRNWEVESFGLSFDDVMMSTQGNSTDKQVKVPTCASTIEVIEAYVSMYKKSSQ